MASIYTNRGKLYMNIRVDGKQYRKSTKLKDTKANWSKVLQEILPNYITSIKKPISEIRLSYYIDKFLDEKVHLLKNRTYIRYCNIINKWIIPRYAEMKILDIKTSVLKSFINEQYNLGKSAKTVELYRTVFSGIIQEAVYDGVIESNPFSIIKRKPKKKPNITPFSTKEVKLLLDSTSGWFHNYIGLATHLGLRSGELIALKWIDFVDDKIKIRRTRDFNNDTLPKTKSSIRDLPLFNSLKPFLDSQKKLTGHLEYVFVKRDQTPWSDTQWIAQKHWYPLLDKLGLKRRRLYEMRHTFATNMLNSGYFKVTDIARMMGHTTTEYLFNVYSKYIESEQNQIPLNKNIY